MTQHKTQVILNLTRMLITNREIIQELIISTAQDFFTIIADTTAHIKDQRLGTGRILDQVVVKALKWKY
jgi:hypothetical protein